MKVIVFIVFVVMNMSGILLVLFRQWYYGGSLRFRQVIVTRSQ